MNTIFAWDGIIAKYPEFDSIKMGQYREDEKGIYEVIRYSPDITINHRLTCFITYENGKSFYRTVNGILMDEIVEKSLGESNVR